MWDIWINSNLGPGTIHKIEHRQQHLSNDHNDRSYQHKNSHKLCSPFEVEGKSMETEKTTSEKASLE